MRNRAINARIEAKTGKSPQSRTAPKKSFGKIFMKDPDTGKVVKEFESIEQAIDDGFNNPNIVGAIKNGKKYKGHLWTAENE